MNPHEYILLVLGYFARWTHYYVRSHYDITKSLQLIQFKATSMILASRCYIFSWSQSPKRSSGGAHLFHSVRRLISEISSNYFCSLANELKVSLSLALSAGRSTHWLPSSFSSSLSTHSKQKREKREKDFYLFFSFARNHFESAFMNMTWDGHHPPISILFRYFLISLIFKIILSVYAT